MAIQTYYETIYKNQLLAWRNFIVKELWIVRGPSSQEKHEFVIAEVKHLRGLDISD